MIAASASLSGKRILLVEDEFYLAEDMAESFAAAGAIVVGPVAAIDDALDLIEDDGSLDGAVLDINLQGEMSFPVAAALKHRGVPLVFATGYDRSHIPITFRDITICEKPVRPSAVGAALFGDQPST